MSDESRRKRIATALAVNDVDGTLAIIGKTLPDVSKLRNIVKKAVTA